MDQKQLRLKRIVISLGILLVICFCIVVGTIAYRLSKMSEEDVLPAAIAEPEAPGIGAEIATDMNIVIPAGSRVIGITAHGQHYLVLLAGKNSEWVQVVNQSDGALVQTIRFSPQE